MSIIRNVTVPWILGRYGNTVRDGRIHPSIRNGIRELHCTSVSSVHRFDIILRISYVVRERMIFFLIITDVFVAGWRICNLSKVTRMRVHRIEIRNRIRFFRTEIAILRRGRRRVLQSAHGDGSDRGVTLASLTDIVLIRSGHFFRLIASQFDAPAHFGSDVRFVSTLT